MAKRCERCGKRTYPAFRAAVAAAIQDSARYGRAYRVYRDPQCRAWHLTTKPAREVRHA